MTPHFQVTATDNRSAARCARLTTPRGEIETPVFMPVGTQATVKAATPDQVNEAGAQIILGNTYHLHLRPGSELIRDLGGLHRFMAWEKPILTDSGGFQVFSLAKLRRISEDGIGFQSHLSGKEFFLGPDEAMRIQWNLDSDIAMVLDECPPYPCSREDCRGAVDRSIRWARRCLDLSRENGFLDRGRHVFAIVQGSGYEDLRAECARALCEMPFPGYAIGGLSVGEPEEEMFAQVGATVPHLPEEKPRYAMGLGTPPQLLELVALGMDMFDCVMPTRMARHGTVFTPDGVVNLRNRRYQAEERPLVEDCGCYTCRRFSGAYLRHLVMSGEILGATLLTLHNLHFFLDLMDQARARIQSGEFDSWRKAWIARYREGEG